MLSTETPDATLDLIVETLDSPEQVSVAERARRAGFDAEVCRKLASSVTEKPETLAPLISMRERLAAEGELAPGALERYLLLTTAGESVARLDDLPIAPTSRRLFRDVFSQWTRPALALDLADNKFIAYAKLASLRRFPAGLLDWEPSGLPRSWVPKIRPLSQMLRALWLAGARWRSFGPLFYGHLTVCRPVRAMLQRDTL